MEENELYDRIGESDLNPNYKDGQVYQHEDVNNMISIFKEAINANYHDIQKLENGETNVGSAGSVDGATVSRYLDEELQPDDNKIPSSQQAKAYIDGLFAEYSAPVRGVDYWTDEDKQEIIDDTSTAVLEDINGKNLFDGLLELGNYSNITGLKFDANNLYRNTNPIPVKPNTTYTFSINGVSQKYCTYYYGENGTFITYDTSLTTGTFTTPANCYYVNFRCFGGDFTSDFANLKIQLEVGDTATDYEPYRKLIKEEAGYVKENTTFYANDFKCRNMFGNYVVINGWITGTTMRVNSVNGNRMALIPCKPNTTYTISRSVLTSSFRVSDCTKIPNMTSSNVDYTVSTVSENNDGTIITYTTSSTAKYIIIHYANIGSDSSSTIESSLATIQLEVGSEATPYTSYNQPVMETNIGVKEDTIIYANDFKCKNLLSSFMELGSLNNDNGTSSPTTDAIRTANFVEVKPNTIYTVSNDKQYHIYIYEYSSESSSEFIKYTGANTDDYKGKATITTTSTTKYIKIRTVISNVENDLTSKWQLEVGSEATSYTEYKNFDGGRTVWINNDPNNQFTPQDININLSEYSFYEIIWKQHATTQNYMQSTGKIPVGQNACLGGGILRISASPRFWARFVDYSSTKLTVSAGYYETTSDNSANTANDIIIPIQIIAYK